MPKTSSKTNPARELVFGDLWEYDPAPETADPKLKPRYDLFINGSYVPPRAGKYFGTINPAQETKIADIALADASDVDSACKSAQKAFTHVWGKMPGKERGKSVVVVLTVFFEGVVMALSARQTSSQEQLRRRFGQDLRCIVDDEIVGGSVREARPLPLDQL